MSVRDGLLAILTIGPAYGHQLHAELRSRAAHRGPVNVGQIYTTIDRLIKQKLVEQSGRTDDGLPLHRLTEAGRTAAGSWTSMPAGAPSADWTEMLDQLLITSTIDVAAARALAGRFDAVWRGEREAAATATRLVQPDQFAAGATRAALEARGIFATAAIDWLDGFVAGLDDDSAFGYSESRPRRGRRPGPREPADAMSEPAS